jgi:hypothetical protein
MDETMIIDIAAENPPRNTVRKLLLKTAESIRNRCLSLNLSLQIRCFLPSDWENKILNSNKYSGNNQIAVRIWDSLLFSMIEV